MWSACALRGMHVTHCACVYLYRVCVRAQVFINNELSLGRQFGQASPGPAVGYKLPQSIGTKQPDGRRADPPQWAFSRALRFPVSHFANDPAPNKYTLPSSISGGKPQVLSRVRSEPSFGFGTCNREVVRKVFISDRHQRQDMFGRQSPGPAAPYEVQSAGGVSKPQTLSRMESASSFSMSTKASFAMSAKSDGGQIGPGPAYMLPAAVGPQVDSRKSMPAFTKFGRAGREEMQKVFIDPELSTRDRYGRGSPGPAAPYQLQAAVGKQVTSKYSTRPKTAFAKSDRWAAYDANLRRNNVPGPGSYDY